MDTFSFNFYVRHFKKGIQSLCIYIYIYIIYIIYIYIYINIFNIQTSMLMWLILFRFPDAYHGRISI